MTYQSAWLSVMEPPDIDMGLTSGDIVARWVRGRGYTIANSYVNTSGDIVASWAPMRVRGGILDLRGHCCQVGTYEGERGDIRPQGTLLLGGNL